MGKYAGLGGARGRGDIKGVDPWDFFFGLSIRTLLVNV